MNSVTIWLLGADEEKKNVIHNCIQSLLEDVMRALATRRGQKPSVLNKVTLCCQKAGGGGAGLRGGDHHKEFKFSRSGCDAILRVQLASVCIGER